MPPRKSGARRTSKSGARRTSRTSQSEARRSPRAARSEGEHRYSDQIGTAFIDGLTFSSKAVQYLVIDGMAMLEGDITLGPADQVEQQTAMRRQELMGQPVAAGVAITGSQFRWPSCTIPYQIDQTLPDQARVTDAIAHWESRTSFRFVLRTPANQAQYPDFVEFVPGNGCSSFVGRQGGRQTVTLGGGCSAGNCIHEIGHVVGLWHEQSREDRDAFVTIQWANIIPAAVNNFAQHITDGDDIGAYDYGSIMHYPRDAFSANGQDTIVPTDPNAQIGQRTALSTGDVAAANTLCPKQFPKELPKELHKELPKELAKEFSKELRKELVKEIPKDWPKDPPKDWPKDPPKDWPKDPPKDLPKDPPKDWPKDPPLDPPKGIIEPPKAALDPPKGVFEPPKAVLEPPKVAFEPPKGILEPPKGALDPPKGLLDPPKGALEPPGPIGPAPFVLATGAQPSAEWEARRSPLLDAYRQLLDRFAQLYAAGLLGPADMAAWQQTASAAQQIASGGL